MSTWSTNTVGSNSFTVPGGTNTSAVVSGYYWTSTNLDYSFPTTGSSWIAGYGLYGGAELYPWYKLRAGEKNAVHSALDSFEGVAGLHFAHVPDNGAQVGLLRYAGSGAVNPPKYAYAYYPAGDPSSGDVWLSEEWFYGHSGDTVSKGTWDYLTILHETGHALGLKHPFDGPNYINPAYDSVMFTVMAYDAVAGYEDSSASRYPTTPMYFDIAALEYIYGLSTRNSGNGNVYTYSASGAYWETIVDGGGINDTLVYNSTYNEVTYMSLVPGDFNEFGQAITYYNAGGQTTDYRTVWIGPSTSIENATGGVGRENMIGNIVANVMIGKGANDTINGGAGADKLYGNDGNDQLLGGLGQDKLYGGAGKDDFIFKEKAVAENADQIYSYAPVDDSIKLDNADFTALALGKLPAGKFLASSKVDALGTGNGQRILYDTDSGNLYYDSNGASGGGKVLIVTVVGDPNVTNADIIVI